MNMINGVIVKMRGTHACTKLKVCVYVECVVCLYNLKMCGGVVSEGVCASVYVQRYVYR